MMRKLSLFRRDERGVGAVEFALALPLLLVAVVGIAQMGILFFAHAGLKNLVAEGARFASISPRPTDSAIKARLNQGGFGLISTNLGAPTVTYGQTGTTDYADIRMTYTLDLDFIFYEHKGVQIAETRRVFLYPN